MMFPWRCRNRGTVESLLEAYTGAGTCHFFQAMVGKTGSSVDAHLAELVNLPLRSGHADFFHCYDLSAGNVLSHRGKQAKDSEQQRQLHLFGSLKCH